jgi:heterodisulfide reductase subunit B
MCQMNLDAYQNETNRFFHTHYNMPIIFFTQLMGVAFGIDPKELGFGKELVSAAPAMSRIGVEVPPPDQSGEAKKPKRGKKDGLPMPHMPGDEEVSS